MGIIETLQILSRHHNNKKLFKDMTREDVISFLDTIRKPEVSDPLHKWIGTYNRYRVLIMQFFKWLYYPNIEQKKRPKPAVVDNIPELKRKETSIYKPTDLWTAQEDLLFVRYVPTKRMKCYHVISRDLSARPHEILKLKIRDAVFKLEGNYQYAEVTVNGKTGTRPIPLISSIPYLKDYLSNEHPQPGNPNAPLICGTGKSIGRPISTRAIFRIYKTYKEEVFPKLLKSPNVAPEDKPKIVELLKKPWTPYLVGRHTSLTAKAKILKEPILKMHAGWSQRSNMHLRYEHWFGNESSKSLLEEYRIIQKDEFTDDLLLLKPKQCPNCNEPNKSESKFCGKCRMVLTYDADNETLEEKQQKESEVKELKEKYEQDMKAMREEIENKFQTILAKIDTSKLVNLSTAQP
jgi:integrase/recombinase XerD